ncbi:MAG TPA: hypothetical protein VFB16_00345 [Bauldia sp.]|nr:hypothetical protein [Bauldia sp.]
MSDSGPPPADRSRREPEPWLRLLLTYLPVWTAVAALVGGVITYFNNERIAATTRLIEARKPYLDWQLDLYKETAQIAGRIATLPTDSDRWREDHERFLQLFWSEMALVEDAKVELAMGAMKRSLDDCIAASDKVCTRADRASLDLGHALRDGIRVWWAE